MTPMRFLLLLLPFVVAACDDMNKPAQVPKSEPRTTCFSDVECPGSKCVKSSANDIQGHCEKPAPPSATSPEGGAEPEIKAAPGDIQI